MRPEAAEWSDGDDACFLSAGYGITPDPWQASTVTDWLSSREDGTWSANQAGLSVPRQNGKNGCLEVRELFGLVVLGERILHTAHHGETADEAMARFVALFENEDYPELVGLVRRISKTNGKGGIYLLNGGAIRWITRTRAGGRGTSWDLLVFDEAQELTDTQQEALLPAISAARLGNPQTIYAGTPPPPDGPGTAFARVRNLALAGGSPRVSWREWSVEDLPTDVHDRSLWAMANPGLGIRLVPDQVEAEAGVMSPAGFARERLGWWQPGGAHLAIDRKVWATLAVDAASVPVDGVRAVGVEVSADRQVVSVAVAVYRRTGRSHLELAHYRTAAGGLDWLVTWLSERWRTSIAAVGIDRQSPAMSLLPELEEAGVQVMSLGTVEVMRAADTLVTWVSDHKVSHFDQEPLNAAVDSATKRMVGSGGGFAFGASGGDASPVKAAALALQAARTTRRRPGRRSRVTVLA